MEFINESDLIFDDISCEKWREYTFTNGKTLRIDWPRYLHVSDSGGHRVVNNAGTCFYIKPTWEYITWQPGEGRPHFVK